MSGPIRPSDKLFFNPLDDEETIEAYKAAAYQSQGHPSTSIKCIIIAMHTYLTGQAEVIGIP